MRFTFYKQHDAMDCGPACLRMVAKFYGKNYGLNTLQQNAGIGREGVSLLGIAAAAEKIGLKTLGLKLAFERLAQAVQLPCIIFWNQDHFVVVYKIDKNKVFVADPAVGQIVYTKDEFCRHWVTTEEKGEARGIALLLEPTPSFFEAHDEVLDKRGFGRVFAYLFTYKRLLVQLMLALITGSIIQLIFPFLSQAIVDFGINNQNLNFVYLILIAQVTLFVGRTVVDFTRSWILLHISTRINISILSDFFVKLMKLPLSFFDVKMYGDIMQRINDHRNIETFLTNQLLSTLFSLFNIVIFGIILASYHLPIFVIFLLCTSLYAIWVILFLKKRRVLNFKEFDIAARNQNNIVQLIQGMQEIKLANAEKQKRWEWEHIQAELFHFNIKNLTLSQYQQAGAFFLNEGKNIWITFLAAKAVIDGQMTLGAMLAVQYIIGQLNSPIEQFIMFLQSSQDAKISLERLNEIHDMKDEEPVSIAKLEQLPEDQSLSVKNVSFMYPGVVQPVLKNINIYIPQGKTTAIVGMSGSGKTTLIKLLLNFYPISSGEIKLGETNLNNISTKTWRSQCGVVLQDGFIFSDTIANNIAIGEEHIDIHRLLHAARVANIHEFIESLPLSYNTKIGAIGNGISQGQKQRILIARAVYKNPKYIFFDEATNALDTSNERIIMENLTNFFRGKTVLVVAHRLSTVKNADQIIVLHRGEVVEIGSHADLASLHGHYYKLVKNQLELGP